MKALIVTGDFSGPTTQPWLMDDLAKSLLARGHSVDVVVLDSTRARPRGEQPAEGPRVRVFSSGTTRATTSGLGKLFSYFATGFRLHTTAWDWVNSESYDLCIYTSIGCFSWGFPVRLRRRGGVKFLLFILWDFFPIHQLEIGRLRSPILAPLMKYLEYLSFAGADVVALMSGAGKQFFSRYHWAATNPTIELPPWASDSNVSPNSARQRGTLRCIFGGQIVKGRGIDTLLKSAKMLLEENAQIEILIAGDGPERARLEREASAGRIANVTFVGLLSRDAYRDLARSCDVGIAITVAGVTPPSFPSKIVEYCNLGLPVLVGTEDSSDAGLIVEAAGAGLAVPVGDPESLSRGLVCLRDIQLTGGLTMMAERARRLFETDFDVNRIVERLEILVSGAR